MTASIEYDLKEILTKLDNRLEKIETKIDCIKEDLNQFKIQTSDNFGAVKTELKGVSEKVEGITKRLDSQEFLSRGVAIGLLVALLGGLAKLFGFNGFN